ncbi:hypothetical protein D9C73_020448 [Collichthys lucidus]|uniref:Uncharacterized protein n=1 Tax=Collichthys lucidus TaxID=240159 RepID=A0A4U5VF66_COLLU|nr:hypothetical protein D9C73_020448 [Collichthys lucidus]
MKVRGPATLGFFHGLVDLVPSLDKVFEEHPRTATVFEGTSKTVQNELLDCMASVIRERIVEELLHQIMPYVDMMYQKLQKRYTDMVFIIIPAELHQQCSGHQVRDRSSSQQQQQEAPGLISIVVMVALRGTNIAEMMGGVALLIR